MAFIIHDSVGFRIPQNRHAVPALIGFIRAKVDLMHIFTPEQPVTRRIGIFIISLWESPAWPALLVAFRVRLDDGDVNKASQTLEMPNQVHTMCEWTK